MFIPYSLDSDVNTLDEKKLLEFVEDQVSMGIPNVGVAVDTMTSVVLLSDQ